VTAYPVTPDGRYFVVRGRLWRRGNPAIPESDRAALVHRLMHARRDVQAARRRGDRILEVAARRIVHRTKVELGERGPLWWNDGAPNYNRRLAINTPYRDWFLSLAEVNLRGA
jgi:hypothetical protein